MKRSLKKFDLLYHRNGPLAGKSRGYGFVSFKNRVNAERAMNELNGRFMLSKNIVIKWAQAVKTEEDENAKLKPLLQLPVLTGPKGQSTAQNQDLKIRAIEKKLKMMEQKSDLEEFLFEPAVKKPKVIKNKPDVSNSSTKK
ncbi:probable RNA-binding protein 18 isoform X2 [Planococcus citri]|uniref:probable RNA-binding protein 18 isoform X2 n=1 Tax=Planococcus citri TaxID=170843 RepID=UPI0031FA053A